MKWKEFIHKIASIPLAFFKFLQINLGIEFDKNAPLASSAREHSGNKQVIRKL